MNVAAESREWPSSIRGAIRECTASRLAQFDERLAERYRTAAYVAECELSDGTGGSQRYQAAEGVCEAITGEFEVPR
jgi:hypothetical protein